MALVGGGAVRRKLATEDECSNAAALYMFKDHARRHSLYPAFAAAYKAHSKPRYKVDTRTGSNVELSTCPRCGQRTMYAVTDQQRSIDEEGTEVIRCLKCMDNAA